MALIRRLRSSEPKISAQNRAKEVYPVDAIKITLELLMHEIPTSSCCKPGKRLLDSFGFFKK